MLFQWSCAGLVQDQARENANDGVRQEGGRAAMELAWFIKESRHRLTGHPAKAEDIALQTSAGVCGDRVSVFPSPWDS